MLCFAAASSFHQRPQHQQQKQHPMLKLLGKVEADGNCAAECTAPRCKASGTRVPCTIGTQCLCYLRRRLLLLHRHHARQSNCSPVAPTRFMFTLSRFIFFTATTSFVGLHIALCTVALTPLPQSSSSS